MIGLDDLEDPFQPKRFCDSFCGWGVVEANQNVADDGER